MTRRALFLSLCFGMALYILATANTPRIEGDGVYYAYASQSLLAGEGLRYHPDGGINLSRHAIQEGGYMTLWAPGYPMLLAVGQWAGLSLTQTASLINALSIAGIAGLMLLLLQPAPLWFQVASVVWIWQGDFIQRQALYVYSDLLFLALWMLLIYLLISHRERLFALVIVGMALPLIRYVGLAGILAGAICLMLWGRGRAHIRLFNAGLFAGASLVPISFWFVRNLAHDGTLMGQRLSTGRDLSEVMGSFADIHFQWVIEGVFVYASVWGMHRILWGVQRRDRVQQSGDDNQSRREAFTAPVSAGRDDGGDTV
jgi:hypothetical protein